MGQARLSEVAYQAGVYAVSNRPSSVSLRAVPAEPKA